MGQKGLYQRISQNTIFTYKKNWWQQESWSRGHLLAIIALRCSQVSLDISGHALLQHPDVLVDDLQLVEESPSQPDGQAEQDQCHQGQIWSYPSRCKCLKIKPHFKSFLMKGFYPSLVDFSDKYQN